jgi:hypothetical protein
MSMVYGEEHFEIQRALRKIIDSEIDPHDRWEDEAIFDCVIRGGRMRITRGTEADVISLRVTTGEGAAHKNKSLICVPSNTKGVTIVRKLDKLGMGRSDTAEVLFEDVRVLQHHRIGQEGMGFVHQMEQFQEQRMGAASSLVTLERALSCLSAPARPACSVVDLPPDRERASRLDLKVGPRREALSRRKASAGRAQKLGTPPRPRLQTHRACADGQARAGSSHARTASSAPAVSRRDGLYEPNSHFALLSRWTSRVDWWWRG